ncbi:hypothetical protein C7H19_15155 [Aphanothece hegewaldii CCALA 016]|uniref:Uncharacterized protein n=1 Tax=Aphanothece hegewaldii CCALA 016 TaxID=2107694 RepID=A0A2T1LVK7_9CHRO|nr:hypothetical protein [Aphanothece hegewaldii]PSF35762.1 hypothetical protein C7H19_15155 [Aphanothece hegewaldii CCALA 016]
MRKISKSLYQDMSVSEALSEGYLDLDHLADHREEDWEDPEWVRQMEEEASMNDTPLEEIVF